MQTRRVVKKKRGTRRQRGGSRSRSASKRSGTRRSRLTLQKLVLDDNEMKIFEVLKEMPPNTRDKIYTSTDKYDDLMNFLIDKKVVVDKEKGKRYFDIFKVASMEAKTPGMSVRMSKLPF